MDNDFLDLLEQFKRIKNDGYIKSHTNLKNGAGITLENLLGESGHDFCYPDYKGIEIKSLRKYWDATFDLFSSTPDSKHVLTTQWLTEEFGYPDKDFKDKNNFKGDIFCKKINKIGLKYFFKLRIERENKKIVLQIFDYYQNLINDEVYWDFEDIQKKLEIKLKKLAVITHSKFKIENDFYYSYDDIKLYTLISFDHFLKMIESDIVCIAFKTGYYKSGKYKGKFHDHGTSFKMSRKDLDKVFKRIY